MLDEAEFSDIDRCWSRIGLWGDGSCPELAGYIHCHNCPVFSQAGRRLLDGRPSAKYMQEWAQLLASEKESARTSASAVVFRLRNTWMALRTGVFQEIVPLLPVHRLPYTNNPVVVGLANVQGELQLTVALDQVLGLSSYDISMAEKASIAWPRLLVVADGGERWAFPVEEVFGVHRIPDHTIQSDDGADDLPDWSEGTFVLEDRPVLMLNERMVFSLLKRSLS